jgi:HK97 family phage major capsid protein
MENRSFRACNISSGKIDEEKRTVDISFSSEEAVERSWGMEILDHSEGSADLSRLNNNAAVFIDHDGDQIGVVKSANINSNEKRGYATIKFSKSVRGQEVFQDIIDGIRTNISFGYVIDRESMEKESDRTFRVRRWTPYEISVVGIPADATIGIGRSSAAKIETKTEEVPEIQEVKKEEIKLEIKEEVFKMSEVDNGKKRVDEIFAIAEKHPELMKEARDAVRNDMSLEDFQKLTIERLYPNAKKVEVPATVKPLLDEKEARKYSLMNVFRSQAYKNYDMAGFEREVSQQLCKNSGVEARGIMVPNEALGTRDYTSGLYAGDGASGGYTVAENLSGDLIPLLKNRMVCLEAGVKVIPGLVGDVTFNKVISGNTMYWVAEGGESTESKIQFGKFTLSPSLLTGHSRITRSVMKQSSFAIEQVLKNEMNDARALMLDKTILHGSGSGAEPEGIITNSSVNSVALGTNGAAFSFAKIVDMETEIAADNADIGSLAYIFNAKTRGKLKTTEKASGTGQFIWEPGNTVNGYRSLVSNQLRSDLTKGSGSALSAAVFGNFADCYVGFWGGIDILVNPYEDAKAGGFFVYIYQNADIQLARTESFCKVVDIVTV